MRFQRLPLGDRAFGLLVVVGATLWVAACGTLRPPPPMAPSAVPQAPHVEPPGDPGLPAAARQALAQRLPWLRPLAHASGHLQVDDADDLAVLLAPAGQAREAVVAVLVTGVAGDYRVVSVSRAVAPGCDACTVTLDIAHRRLSVHVLRPADAAFERLTWQFGYSDDALRLVGVTAAQPAGDDPIAHSYAISTDLVAGIKVDTLDPTSTEPGHRRELRANLALRPPIAFDAFDFAPRSLEAELRRRPVSAFDARETLPPAAVAVLRARFPGSTALARSTGALRADGGHDLAVVLAPAAGSVAEPVLALLFEQPGGAMRLAATSGPLASSCQGCDVQVQIGRRALVVQTVSGPGMVGWQFMATGKTGALRLVGLRTVQATRGLGGERQRYVSTTNLLTGDKLEVIENIEQGHRRRAEHAGNVPLRPAMPLAGFAFDADRLDAETRRDFIAP